MQISENREQRTGYMGKLEYFNTIKEAVTMTLTEEDPVSQLRALKLASLIPRRIGRSRPLHDPPPPFVHQLRVQ